MADRALEWIDVAGLTSIRAAHVDLGQLNVLVGANGAGKSNFIRAFELLGRIVDRDLEFYVGLVGGASALMNADSAQSHIRIALGPRTRYQATLVAAANDELIFETEWVGHVGRDKELSRGHRETKLHDYVNVPVGEDSLAGPAVALLEGCRVFHFHDTGPNARVKLGAPSADNLALHADASNLASILLSLKENHQSTYRRIVGAVRLVAPFFRDFVLRVESVDRVRLRWRQHGVDTVFSAEHMSDGTLRFICLATLLLQPELPSLVVLDEPELGLHPYAIVQLAGLLRQASARSQVLIATQSVTLMNQFEIDDLIVVERVDGASTFSRPDQEKLREWLAEYSLGELWEKNIIGGRPGSSS